jgi:hypothetical protein
MNINLKEIIIWILILILCFFIGRWTSPVETKIVKITIPSTSGNSSIINNPKPIITIKDSLVYKDSLIYTDNPINKQIIQDYLELENRYTGLELKTQQLLKFVNLSQIRKYQIPFENDTIKIIGDIEVQGELKSLKYNWIIKEKTFDTTVEIKKPTMNLLLGGSVSNNIDLNKFNINANIGIQRKNGDLILGSYGTFDKTIQVGYLVNLKL